MKKKDQIKEFSTIIESLVKDKKLSYMDAIVHHCEMTGFELEVAAKLVSKKLKEKLKEEANVLNMMKK